MEIASWLADVYGSRLTGSPSLKAAADWAVTALRSWGLSDVHLEPWGPYDSGLASEQWGPQDRGWSNERFEFRAVEPRRFTIHAVPAAWSPGTRGCIRGAAVRFDVHSFADMQRFAGKLKNAFVLVDPPAPTPAHFLPEAHRWTDAELEVLAAGTSAPLTRREVFERRFNPIEDPRSRHRLVNEGVAAVLFPAPGDGGTIHMAERGGNCSRRSDSTDELPTVMVAAESYGRVVRILEKDIAVTLELDVRNTFYENPDVFNVIAQISGADPKLKDELVMIGAHLDSWTFGTGATDDAAGCAVVMEAMRILAASHVTPRRTIRVALWTGEEQGALGSNTYVQKHFADWVRYARGDRSATKPAHASFAAYFNVDAGAGKIRGVFQQQNAAVGPIFDAWMGPFKRSGMKTLCISSVGGGDNHAFERVGLPSFGFIQDPIEYGTRTHHTSADVYERLQPEDMRFNATVLASFAWQAAQRDAKLPRSSGER